ncbi:MAG: sigma-70 family RNA polymerase sigma factor [Burkholderiales bacterium]|jgi:RNA polymerase sigma-70 factor (ECF subfamily)|nr:sigma-70 family RNA polymerase sigma factor [Burkholderiales bacterium]
MSQPRLHETLGELRPMLLKIARLQLRNDTWAEDVVSETMIAALEGARDFAGRSQLKTWVVGILKHKIVDQFRSHGREVSVEAQMEASEAESFDELFSESGHFRQRPLPGWGDPHDALSQNQFIEILQACVDKLPANLGRIFMMREWMELETDEVCKELGITSTNAFVMLYRARMRLRECLEANWFAPARAR